jgi:protease-4
MLPAEDVMMKRFLKSLLKVALWLFISLVIVLVITAATMGPSVKQNTALVLDLSGPVPEEGPQDWREKLLIGEVLTTRGVLYSLHKAATDDRIRALIVNSTFAQVGTGKAQELRAAIKGFAAKSRKPVYGFVEDGTTTDYYICSAAPKLYLPPEGDSWFTLIGIRAEHPFYKGTFDKLGVEPQMDHIGKFKSGSESYTRESMSDPDREQTNALLDSLFQRVTQDIAQDRNMTPETVRALVDQSPLISSEMKAKGLVDDLIYRDQLEDMIKKQLSLKELHTISVLDYQKPTFRDLLSEKPDKIALIYATGMILPGESYRNLGEDFVGSSTVSGSLKSAREDSSVKAIVFRIDSPGGSPSASDVIWREITITAKKKPVIVSMADVAASGGYYIAMGGTKIFAEPSTITGSIGVYGGKFVLKGLYDKIGMTKDIIKRGEHADLFSDYVPFSDEEWALIRKHMQDTYNAFTRKAALGRNKTQQQIDAIGQGRVWSGEQALKIGLIDRIGGLTEAIQEAKKMAKMKDYSLLVYPSSRGASVTDLFSENSLMRNVPAEMKRLLMLTRLVKKEPVLLLMPYQIFIN